MREVGDTSEVLATWRPRTWASCGDMEGGSGSDTLSDLAAITGLPHEEAEILLAAAGGDLATAVQLHFDREDGDAAVARDAAMAAQVAADEYGGDGEGEDDEEGDDEDFPDELDHTPPRRLARSPEPAGGGAVAARYPRLGMLYGWLAAYVPFFSYAQRFGRYAYRTGIIGFLGSLLWAPLALIGLVGGGRRPGAPAGPVRPFSDWFEEHHGQTHPHFFRGSCQSALSRSRADAKFLLAILHEHGSPECEQFCSTILASALFTAFANENFIVWVGELHTPEGRAVRRALRVSQQPAVVLLAHGDMAAAAGMGGGLGGGDGPPVQALGSVQGARALNEEGLIASLASQLEAFEPLLVAARAEQHERMNDRLLREEQDAEYQRSLAEDEAKDAAEAASREAAARAAEATQAAEAEAQAVEAAEAEAAARRQAERSNKAATLPPEPPAGVEATRLVIRLPDGRRLDRRFDKTCLLQAAIDLVESEVPDGDDIDLVSNYPRKVFTREMRGETLEALGLHPAATLFTREVDDE